MALYDDAPTAEALREADPTLVIPEGYEGSNSNPDWASLIASLVQRKRLTLAEATAPIRVAGKSPKLIDTYSAYAKRFKINDSYPIGMALLNITQLQNPSGLFYTLRCADMFEDRTKSVATTLPLLYQREDRAGQDNNGIIPLSELQKFFALYSGLRAEGIMKMFQDVFLYSIHWSTSDFIALLAEEVDLETSLKMEAAGIKGAEEILRMFETVPTELLNEILED